VTFLRQHRLVQRGRLASRRERHTARRVLSTAIVASEPHPTPAWMPVDTNSVRWVAAATYIASMPTRAVLVDLYDTLVSCDFAPLRALVAEHLAVPVATVVAAYDATRAARGTGVYPSPGAAMATIVATCGREPEPTLVQQLVGLEREFLAGAVRLYPDSLDLLRWLRGSGTRTALVSNCSPATGAVVDTLGLAGELDAVVLSFEAGALKPAPKIFRDALERLAAAPSETWFLDDQVSYCDGARRLGIRPVRIVRGDPGPGNGDAPYPQVGSLRAARPYLGLS
jgi:putative hydrolase of the HAD superfamily